MSFRCLAAPPFEAGRVSGNILWGDCWCTLQKGHEGPHSCEPCELHWKEDDE